MKKVVLKRGARICSVELAGCGRTIKQGEICYKQKRPRSKKQRVRYMCKECWERKSY